MKYCEKKIAGSFLFLLFSFPLFAFLPGTSHSCLKQNDDTITFRFTVPTGTVPNIGRVRIYFDISDLSSKTLSYSDVLIDPQSSNLAYGPFTVSGYLSPHNVALPYGYNVSLHNEGTNSFQLEIINLLDGSGYWDTTDAALPGPDYWEVTITIDDNNSISEFFGLNLTDIRAYLPGETDEANFTNPTPAGLEFTYAFPCNQPPTAILTETAGTGAVIYTSDANTIYGPVPLFLDLTPDMSDPDGHNAIQYRWDLDGDGTVYEEVENFVEPIPFPTPAPAVQIQGYNNIGINTIGLIARDETTADSPATTKTVYILPDETMYFPRAIGLPYDSQKSPFVDGVLKNDHTEPVPRVNPPGDPHPGIAYGENGWRGAYMLPYGTDATGPDVAFQGIRHRTEDILYFGFEVGFDSGGFDANDEIYLGIRGDSTDPTAATAADRLIRITPSTNVMDVVLRNGNGWDDFDTAAITNPGGLVCAHFQDPVDTNRWYVEIQVPKAASGSWQAVNDQFLFYFEVFKADGPPSTGSIAAAWPRAVFEAVFFTDDTPGYTWETSRRNPLWWGTVDLTDSTARNGIYLNSSSRIGTRHPVNNGPADPLTSTIYYDETGVNDENNQFVARVQSEFHKQTIDSGGNIVVDMLDARQVTATFKIANWGIASAASWQEIGTAGPENIPAVDTGTLNPAEQEFQIDWVAPDSTRDEIVANDPDGINETHQCILVELNARDTNVVTKSVHRNMNYAAVNDEKFTHKADISALGYEMPLNGEPNQKFLLRIQTRKWEVNLRNKDIQAVIEGKDIYKTDPPESLDIKSAAPNVRANGARKKFDPHYYSDLMNQRNVLEEHIKMKDSKVSYIEYIVKGYLYTGKMRTVNGQKFDLVKPVGAYGHVVRHKGTVDDWDFEISGEGVTRLNENTYLLEIAPETVGRIIDNVKAMEPPKWMVHLYGGAGFNGNALPADYTIGLNGIAGAGYYITPSISANLLFGYNYFNSGTPSVEDYQLMSLSANIRFHMDLPKSFSLSIGVGPGVYFGPTMDLAYGANTGLEVDYKLTRNLYLEAGLDYHYFINKNNQFLHAHAGVQFRF